MQTRPEDAPAVEHPLLSVVIPTRNEAHSVRPLMARISAALAATRHELIFVDDSDDDTVPVLEGLAASEYPQIRVIHRLPGQRADGLSGAVIAGFGASNGEYVAVMDADLQHPPELLPRLLKRAHEQGADVVVASRYVGNGSAAGFVDPTRRLVSRATALLTRLLFLERIWRISDPCSGFFVVRRDLLDGAILRPIGYKILLEVLLRTKWRSFAEVPYRFSEREADASKANLGQGILFLKHCARLLRELPAAGLCWKFTGAGAIAAGAIWLLRHYPQR